MTELKDFRGTEWGTSYHSLNDMIIYAQAMDGRLKYCIRTNDIKRIGKCDVESIVYSFFDDKFYEVQIVSHGWNDTLALLEYLVPILGSTYSFYDTKVHKLYLWEGDTVEVWCGYNKPSNSVELVYAFKPIKTEILESENVPVEERIMRKDVVLLELFSEKTGIEFNELVQRITDGKKLF